MRPPERWRSLPPLEYALPLVFDSGTQVGEMGVECPRCRRDLPLEQTHGDVRYVGVGFLVRTLTFCHRCAMWTHSSNVVYESEPGNIRVQGPRGAVRASPWNDEWELLEDHEPNPLAHLGSDDPPPPPPDPDPVSLEELLVSVGARPAPARLTPWRVFLSWFVPEKLQPYYWREWQRRDAARRG